jgi:hypothetical protein
MLTKKGAENHKIMNFSSKNILLNWIKGLPPGSFTTMTSCLIIFQMQVSLSQPQ